MVQVATDKAEGAQALFCYIADAIGSRQIKKAYKPYLDGQQNAEYFFTEYNDLVNKAFSSRAVDTINSKNQIKQYVIDNKDWFMSSSISCSEETVYCNLLPGKETLPELKHG